MPGDNFGGSDGDDDCDASNVAVTVTVMLATRPSKMFKNSIQLQGWTQHKGRAAIPFRAPGVACQGKNSQAFQDKLTWKVQKSRAACWTACGTICRSLLCFGVGSRAP